MDDPKNYPPPTASMTLDGELTVHTKPPNVFDIERYMKAPGRCGFCGSSNIDAGFFDMDAGAGTTPVQCSDCGARWCDYYKLEGVGDVYGPSGKYIGEIGED